MGPRCEASGKPLSPVVLLLTVSWFGLVTGLAELVRVFVLWLTHPAEVLPAELLGPKVLNRHYLWMMPVADLVIFGLGGLVVALVARRWPRLALRIAIFGAWAFAGVVWIPVSIHVITRALIGCAIASMTVGRIEGKVPRISRFARRSLPALVVVVLALVVYSYGRERLAESRALASLPAASPGAPNVLLIVLDTVRADALSTYGYRRPTSPNLSRLASQGVRFDGATATASWTLPSHASLFTGEMPRRLGVDKSHPLDAKFPTLAETLAAHGYATAGFAANYIFCNRGYGLARGFAHYEDRPVSLVEVLASSHSLGQTFLKGINWSVRYPLGRILGEKPYFRAFGEDPRDTLLSDRQKDAARINRDALNWLSSHSKKPFFVFLNYFDVHVPYFPHPDREYPFGPQSIPGSKHSLIRSWSNGTLSAPMNQEEITLVRDCYDQCLTYLDDQIGRLFEGLEERGLLENTLVIITADHGEQFGEHGRTGHANSVYRQVLGVPLLVIDPRRVPSGRVVSTPVSLRDIPATIVDLVGLPGRSPFQGRSLARFWDPDTANDPASFDPVLASTVDLDNRASGSGDYSVRVDDMNYIRNADSGEELYNLAKDPAEDHNLIGSEDARPVVERLREIWKQKFEDGVL
jgi:arylsulfatase A-like enzyme